MRARLWATTVAVGLLLTSMAAIAAPAIAYDEDVSGDLTWIEGASPLLNLVPGENQVLGRWSWAGSESTSSDPDYDAFRFMAPSGYLVTRLTFSASYAFTRVYHFSIGIEYHPVDETGYPYPGLPQYPAFQLFPMAYGVIDEATEVLSDQVLSTPHPQPFPATSGMITLPAGANVTYFRPSFEIQAAYTFGLLVEPIGGTAPEPGTLALAALGLTALGLTRRRRQ